MSEGKSKCVVISNASYRLFARGGVFRLMAKFLWAINRFLFSCDIQIGAQIDPSTHFYHGGLGVVVHKNAVIGRECIVMQGVTIGSALRKEASFEQNDVAPIIGDGVLIGAGATVLGDVRIGDGSVIGAGAVVTKSVPANSTVVGIPARVI